jgi:hypothetical protein
MALSSPAALEELGPPQPALDEIVEDSAPGLGALAAHALDREQHLLAVRAHAENDEQRDGGRLAVEPHANDGAVENDPYVLGQRTGVPGVLVALHLAPRSAQLVSRPHCQTGPRARGELDAY